AADPARGRADAVAGGGLSLAPLVVGNEDVLGFLERGLDERSLGLVLGGGLALASGAAALLGGFGAACSSAASRSCSSRAICWRSVSRRCSSSCSVGARLRPMPLRVPRKPWVAGCWAMSAQRESVSTESAGLAETE